MANPTVGYRFRPNDVELVKNYLLTKNGGGDTTDVDRFIRTINICRFDPWELRFQSVIQSRDQVWYFFGCIEKKYKRGDQQIRKTKSGFWKKTGKTMKIFSGSGDSREQIGEKRVLVFHCNKSKTNWVMHEYHLSPLNPMMAYTICKVKFKGAETEISSPPPNEISLSSITDINNNNSGVLSLGSEVGQSQNLTASEGISFDSLHREELQNPRQFSGFPHLEEETQFEDAMRKAINNLSDDDFDNLLNAHDFNNNLLNDDEQSNIVSMQQDRNDYGPKKPLTGVMVDVTSDDSDTNSVSATTISIKTWTTCDSFGSSDHRIHQITDLQEESPSSTIKLVPITQEVSQVLGPVTETGEHKLGQETIKKKRGGSFYKMIQRLTKKLKLCSSI